MTAGQFLHRPCSPFGRRSPHPRSPRRTASRSPAPPHLARLPAQPARHYTAAAPDLAPAAAAHRRELDATDADTEPKLLHLDLQPGHLVRPTSGKPLLLDWELAAFGDPLSDLARLAVRLDLPDPTGVLHLVHRPDPDAVRRLCLYWRIHQLADAALSTDPVVRQRGRARLP
ncbi:phosphotransferase family protein [Streptomyces sp. MN3]